MNCQVCIKHKNLEGLPGGALFENEHIFIAHFPLLSGQKAHRGHLILEFKRHITEPSQLQEVEAIELGKWTPTLSKALEKTLGAEHIYILRIGDVTPHLHFHFVPRYPGAPQKTWGPLHHTWPEGPKADAKEMIEITEQLKRYLKL